MRPSSPAYLLSDLLRQFRVSGAMPQYDEMLEYMLNRPRDFLCVKQLKDCARVEDVHAIFENPGFVLHLYTFRCSVVEKGEGRPLSCDTVRRSIRTGDFQGRLSS